MNLSLIVDLSAEQERWIAEAESVFERMRRWWKCESKNNGWDPERQPPREVSHRRAREFREAMESSGGLVDKIREPGEEG